MRSVQHRFLIGLRTTSICLSVANRIDFPVLSRVVLHVSSRFAVVTGAPTVKDSKIHLVVTGVQKAVVAMPKFEHKIVRKHQRHVAVGNFSRTSKCDIVLIWYGKHVLPVNGYKM